MTLPAANPRISYLGNNTTGTYAWNFLANVPSDLHVAALAPQGWAQGTGPYALVYGVDWGIQTPTLQLGASAGGNIVLSATGFFAFNNGVLPGGWALIIRRTPTFGQDTTLYSQGAYDPASIESGMDELAMQILQLQDQLNHVVQMPTDDYTAPSQNVGLAAGRAGGYLVFDSQGNPYTTPALIEGVPAAGTTVAGTPAVALSNLAEGLSDLVNQTITLTSSDGATYSWQVDYGIYGGMLVTVIWATTNTTTTPYISSTIYNPLPLPPLVQPIVNKDLSALSIGQLAVGSASLLFYDGLGHWRVLA